MVESVNNPSPWAGGRVDGVDRPDLRWHQLIQPKAPYTFLGFCCDEGVRRNKGRQGAYDGPDAIRTQMRNFPAHSLVALSDRGNVYCDNSDLVSAQQKLAKEIASILSSDSLPVVLGGGHEVAWGSFQGIQEFLDGSSKSLGIINIDAHFDLRKPEDGSSPTSGTSFWHMHQHARRNNLTFNYHVLGIQKMGNTPRLFETAKASGTSFSYAHHIEQESTRTGWQEFIERVDCVYLTVCLDAFSAALAPGVSAPGICGINAGSWLDILFSDLKNSGKLICMDIAEMNPKYDIDNRTARFAASLVYRMLEGI